jgi:hypothetical protein
MINYCGLLLGTTHPRPWRPRVSNTNPTDIHPGLTGKPWQNPTEIAGNNIDDGFRSRARSRAR